MKRLRGRNDLWSAIAAKTPWRLGFEAGLTAQNDGAPYPQSNPYVVGSRDHWSWMTGVMDAYGDEYPDSDY
jgi:hypothetical protein